MNIKIIRSGRRTLSVEVNTNGLTVRAPFWATKGQINAFLHAHDNWIKTQTASLLKTREAASKNRLTVDELNELKRKAKSIIPERAAYYAALIGVSYGRISIRSQRTKWGSCSAKGNLNFNCLLMLAPPEVLESVVVHELCHRKEMNHSKRFYDEVLRVFPEYKKWNKWLKDNGAALMARLPE